MQGDLRWCWIGLAAWGRIEPQGYPGRMTLGRATWEGGIHAGEVEMAMVIAASNGADLKHMGDALTRG